MKRRSHHLIAGLWRSGGCYRVFVIFRLSVGAQRIPLGWLIPLSFSSRHPPSLLIFIRCPLSSIRYPFFLNSEFSKMPLSFKAAKLRYMQNFVLSKFCIWTLEIPCWTCPPIIVAGIVHSPFSFYRASSILYPPSFFLFALALVILNLES